ncbi:MAG: hypothetical protein LWW85_13580 [Marinilabiliales bacterium]|nr:hypothetical protein [Marinilabiliales bacterium]
MNDLELIKLWQVSQVSLEDNMKFNRQSIEEITHLKVHGILGSMKPFKKFALLIGFLWVSIGVSLLSPIYLNSYSEANKFFLFSASIQVGLTALALLVYLYQRITIYQVDLTEPILRTQKKLARLQATTLWTARILVLQLPFWTTFWWNDTLLNQWGMWQWAITLVVTLASIGLALWLFFHLTYENRNKQWFQLIFSSKEWEPLMKSIALLEQLEAYPKQETRA